MVELALYERWLALISIDFTLEKDPNSDTTTCQNLLVSAAISGKLASGTSTATITQLYLYHLWLNFHQGYINHRSETAVSTLAWYQRRTPGEQPTIPCPQCLCTNLDSRHAWSVSQSYSSGGTALARAVFAATAMTQTCQ